MQTQTQSEKPKFNKGDKFDIDGIPMRIDVVLENDRYRLYAPFGYRGLFKERSAEELSKIKEAKV